MHRISYVYYVYGMRRTLWLALSDMAQAFLTPDKSQALVFDTGQEAELELRRHESALPRGIYSIET